MIAVQKRSSKRHLINGELGTTMCGRTLYRSNWRVEPLGRNANCEQCSRVLAAKLGIRPLFTPPVGRS